MTDAHYTLVSDAMLEQVAQRFRALGDSTRLGIIRWLLGNGEASVGQIVDELGMSQANVSKHLRTLLDVGVVSRRAEGTSAFYTVTDPSVERLCELVCGRIEEQTEQQTAALRG